MAEKFRSSAEVIRIEVNDDGDIVKLPVSDEGFIKRFYVFLDNAQKEAEKLDSISDEATILDKINADVDFHDTLRVQFDELFGAGSYEAVYGKDVLVGVEYITEFIEACLPYIEKHHKKRAEKFSKYSADRVGSSS